MALNSQLQLVSEKNFEQEVLRSPLPVLVCFLASWSAPCKQVEIEANGLAAELEGKAKIFVRVDAEKSPVLAQEFQVQGVPFFAVVAQGRLAASQGGPVRRAQLRAMLEPFFPRSQSSLRVEEFLKLAQAGRVVAVDTRDKPSYLRAHLPGAVHIALAEVATVIDRLASTGRVPVLYCRSGNDTKEVAEKLGDQGYPIAFLEGGLLGWELAGQPIERGEN